MTIRRLLALALTATTLLALPAPTGAAPAPERDTLGGVGTVLYFQRYVGEDDAYHYQVWALHEDGESTAVVTDPWFEPYAADLSPDGRRVAMTVGHGSSASASSGGLYVTGIDGSGRRNILAGNTRLTEARDPDWSPDGKRLVFVGVDKAFDYDLWTVKADGSGLTRLTSCDCAWENVPRWSPDGRQVLWSPNTYDVSVLDVATGQTRTVYDNAPSGHMNVQTAEWAPDGQGVVLSASASWDTVPLALWSLPLTGGTPTRIGPELEGMSYANPTFSPDGDRLGFTESQASDDDYYSVLGAVAAGGPYNVVSLHGHGPVETFASWEAECDCHPGDRFSSLSVHTHDANGVHQVSGGLLPGLYGQSIRLVMQRRTDAGRWRTVRSTTVTTSPESLYYAELARPAYGTCRVTATWAGDATHDPARARTATTC